MLQGKLIQSYVVNRGRLSCDSKVADLQIQDGPFALTGHMVQNPSTFILDGKRM